jgi:hypothetical protein
VADAVIEACNLFALSFTLTSNCSGSLIEIKRFVHFRPGKTTPLLKLDGSKYSNRSRLAQNLAPPMTSQEVNAALRQSLGLPEVSESKPTIPDYLNVPRLLILHCLTLPLVPASSNSPEVRGGIRYQ